MKAVRWRPLGSALLSAMLASHAAVGQERFSTITGSVVDESGAAVPGVVVTLTHLETKRTIVRTTDANGSYTAREIEPGRYAVRCELSGFATTEVADVILLLGKTLRIPTTLKIGAVTETVQVESPLIDIGSTARGNNIPAEEFESLPKGRSFESLATALPSVNAGQLEGGIQVNGASAGENNFTVDSVSVNSLVHGHQRQEAVFEHLQEVQVKTSGLSAEYGGALGGVISAVTRSGGNDFRGSVFYYYGSDALASTNGLDQRLVLDPVTQNRAYTVQDTAQTFDRHEVGASLGGPILEDKLFFFASTSQVFESRARDYQLGTGLASGHRELRAQSNFGKLTWEATRRLRFNVSALHTPTKAEGTLPAFNGADANGSTQAAEGVTANNALGFKTPQWQAAGTVDYTISNATIVSLRAGHFHDSFEDTGVDTSQTYEYNTSSVGLAGVPAPYQQPAGYSNLPRAVVSDHDLTTRKYVNLELTTFLQAAGTHSLKLGGGWSRCTNDVELAYPNQGFVTVSWDQSFTSPATGETDRGTYGYYTIDQEGTIGETRSDVLHLFVQDSWRVTPRLTLDLGLRAEHEQIPTFRPDIQKYAFEFGWGEKLAPRVGIAYDVNGDGKLKLSASYGRYFDWTKYELARLVFGGYALTTRYRTLDDPDPTKLSRAALTGTNLWTSAPDSFQDHSVPSFGDDVIDPDIQPMSQDAWNVGAEYQLASNTVVGVNYIHTDLNRTIEDVGTVVNGNEVFRFCNPGENLCSTALPTGATAPFPISQADPEIRRPRGVPQPPLRPQLVPGRQLRPEPPLRELRGHRQHRPGGDRRPPVRCGAATGRRDDERGQQPEPLVGSRRADVRLSRQSRRGQAGDGPAPRLQAVRHLPVRLRCQRRGQLLRRQRHAGQQGRQVAALRAALRRRPRVARPHGLPDQHRRVPEPGHQAGRPGSPAAAGAQRPQRLRPEAGAAHLRRREPRLERLSDQPGRRGPHPGVRLQRAAGPDARRGQAARPERQRLRRPSLPHGGSVEPGIPRSLLGSVPLLANNRTSPVRRERSFMATNHQEFRTGIPCS